MLKIGFTGTRRGLTEYQREAIDRLIADLEGDDFHAGCAVGADEDAMVLADQHGYRVIGHPSVVKSQTSDRALRSCRTILPARPPLDRNRDIVLSIHRLIACPAGFSEELRSGTWMTVRVAVSTGRPTTIVWPDGTVENRGDPRDADVQDQRQSPDRDAGQQNPRRDNRQGS